MLKINIKCKYKMQRNTINGPCDISRFISTAPKKCKKSSMDYLKYLSKAFSQMLKQNNKGKKGTQDNKSRVCLNTIRPEPEQFKTEKVCEHCT